MRSHLIPDRDSCWYVIITFSGREILVEQFRWGRKTSIFFKISRLIPHPFGICKDLIHRKTDLEDSYKEHKKQDNEECGMRKTNTQKKKEEPRGGAHYYKWL